MSRHFPDTRADIFPTKGTRADEPTKGQIPPLGGLSCRLVVRACRVGKAGFRRHAPPRAGQ